MPNIKYLETSVAASKKDKGIKELLKLLNNDGIKAEISDPESTGKSGDGDLVISFKGRKYPVAVERKQSVPNSALEKLRDDSDILAFRKNRRKWKVYMDLSDLILLLLNRRS